MPSDSCRLCGGKRVRIQNRTSGAITWASMCAHCDRLCMTPGCKPCAQVNRSKNT